MTGRKLVKPLFCFHSATWATNSLLISPSIFWSGPASKSSAVFNAVGTYLNINGQTDENGRVAFDLPEGAYKFRVDHNGTQHWSDEIAIIAHGENSIELDLALLALQLTNDPAPDRFDGEPPVYEKEPVLLASLFDIQGILANSVVANTGGGLQAYYFINDHLGTPQIMLDETGVVVWEGEYEPFGEVNVSTEDRVNNFRFPGQYYDSETGLHYNYHRYYDPKTGRYLTPDPIGLEGGINLFLYANANPINFVDIFGIEPLSECAKQRLAPYFPGLNLNDIEIHEGIPWYVRAFSEVDPAAYTSGNDIYFAPGQYNAKSSAGLALIGHEITHSQQYSEHGTWGFRWKYYKDYKKNLKAGMNEYEAYENIPFEIHAYNKKRKIYNDFLDVYGRCNNPCP